MHSIEAVRTWLSNRDQMGDQTDHYQTNCIVQPREPQLIQYNLPELHLRRLQKPSLLTPLKRTRQQLKIELADVIGYLSEFLTRLKQQVDELECLEQMCNPGVSKQLAQFHVSESIDLVKSALTFDNQIVDLSSFNHLVDYIEIDSTKRLQVHELMREILMRLLTQTPAYLFVEAAQYRACLLCSFLVDLLHSSGAPKSHLQLFACNNTTNSLASILGNRAQEGGEDFVVKPSNQQTTLYICFNDMKIDEAVSTILEGYLREPENPHAIVLIEHSIYQFFVESWQANYSKSISSSDGLNLLEICVDLNSIDISVARKTRGNCINMIKFHSIEELYKLVMGLRGSNSIVHIQLWTKDVLLARELAGFGANSSKKCSPKDNLKFNCENALTKRCRTFWLNHLPAKLSGRRFQWQLIEHYRSLMRQRMDGPYSEALLDHDQVIEKLRRKQVSLSRKRSSLLQSSELILRSYITLISKHKLFKQTGYSIEAAAKKLKSFLCYQLYQTHEVINEFRLDQTIEPVGLAILSIEDKTCIKSKAAVIEFVYRNLLLGNAVLVICPKNLLGTRFPQDLYANGKLLFELVEIEAPSNDAIINGGHRLNETDKTSPMTSCQSTPSKSAPLNLASPDTSRLVISPDGTNSNQNLSASTNNSTNDGSIRISKCPQSVYTIKLSKRSNPQLICQEFTSELSETLVVVLGCQRRFLWYADESERRAQYLNNVTEPSEHGSENQEQVDQAEVTYDQALQTSDRWEDESFGLGSVLLQAAQESSDSFNS